MISNSKLLWKSISGFPPPGCLLCELLLYYIIINCNNYYIQMIEFRYNKKSKVFPWNKRTLDDKVSTILLVLIVARVPQVFLPVSTFNGLRIVMKQNDQFAARLRVTAATEILCSRESISRKAHQKLKAPVKKTL